MATAPRDPAVPAVYIILRRLNGEFLLLYRDRTNYRDNEWSTPAGHVDAGEMPREAAARELREETGVVVDAEEMCLVHTSFRPKHDATGARIDFYLEYNYFDGEVVNAEPGKHGAVNWFTRHNLPDNMTPHVRYALECIDRGETYSEIGYDFLEEHGYMSKDAVTP